MPAAGQPPPGARPNRDELLREGRLLVSLEFQVGCTEARREVRPRQMITSVEKPGGSPAGCKPGPSTRQNAAYRLAWEF